MEERLHKFLAKAGVASRRHSEQLIQEGRVAVNGKVVKELGTKVNPETDIVTVDGKEINTEDERFYIMLNKPAGFITSSTDQFGRATVLDLLGDFSKRVYPVGRLDFNTEGLLFLTNDGELAFRLSHPRYKVKKTYLVEVFGKIEPVTVRKLRSGIDLEDGITAPADVIIIEEVDNYTRLEITISEGRKRQIRRMLDFFHHPVTFLKRISIDGVELGELPLGTYRHLDEKEVTKLYSAVRLL